jgi:enoyl-CoA hydratase/carnithine racemase
MSEKHEFSQIQLSVSENIATITLNRPEKLNAFTNIMLHEIIAAFDLTDDDDDVRAVIVTGAGRAFCAGADLSSGGETFSRGGSDVQGVSGVPRDGGGLVSLRIFNSKKPVIGAINGPAVGVGVTMTLPMDIRLVSNTSTFGFVFTRRGIVTEACSSWFLPRVVGISRATEWVFTGRMVARFPSTQTAHSIPHSSKRAPFCALRVRSSVVSYALRSVPT